MSRVLIWIECPVWRKFLFQIGAIRSRDLDVAFLDDTFLFRFQTDAIKRVADVQDVDPDTLGFQFQTGAIKSGR